MFSPPLIAPATPVRRSAFGAKDCNRPLYSSPLATCGSSSPIHAPDTSPIASAQARRRAQYKVPGGGSSASYTSSTRRSSLSLSLSSSSGSSGRGARMRPAPAGGQADPQQDFLRQKFMARCFERERKAREQAVLRTRRVSGRGDASGSSDGPDVDMDVEEEGDEDEAALNGEFYRRIIANDRRRRQHAVRLSYEQTVGSSIDPSMEDVDAWEREILESSQTYRATNTPVTSQQSFMDVEGASASSACDSASAACAEPPDEFDLLDDDEIAEMYEEYVKSSQQERLSAANDSVGLEHMEDSESSWGTEPDFHASSAGISYR